MPLKSPYSERCIINLSERRIQTMKHNLSISVSNKNSKIVTCKNVSLREKFMRLMFGDLHKVAILLPGDSVEEVAITELAHGGDKF